MVERTSSDAVLVNRSASGDRDAFVALVRRHEQPLAALIRREVADAHAAEDILQDTLVNAWIGIRGLRDATTVRGWLLRIARNRCYDFRKSAQRRERTVDPAELSDQVDQLRQGRAWQRTEVARDAVQALEAVPGAEREAVRLFYLEGMTIAEIAVRTHSPEGTVKRRLFTARNHLRRTLEVRDSRRSAEMPERKSGSMSQPFPLQRPPISITPSRAKPFAVDARELPWWFGIPEVGDKTLWSIYDPPEWRVTSVTQMHATRSAEVHGVAGTEIEVGEWEPEAGWVHGHRRVYGRLTRKRVEWLAVSRLSGDKRILRSYLDDGFEEDWGSGVRALEDRGHLRALQDGSYQLRRRSPGAVGAGVFSVKIGDRRAAPCLRVFDFDGGPVERGELVEAYLNRAGRTVLFRRYNGLRWRTKPGDPTWSEKLPGHAQVVVNGVTFVHWYDCLTDTALGMASMPIRC